MTNLQRIQQHVGFAGRPRVLRVIAGLWLAVAVVNAIVWCFQAAITGSPDAPWFAWSVAPAVPIAGAWWLFAPAKPVPERA